VAALSVLVSHVWLYVHLFGPSSYSPFLHDLVAGGGLGVQLFFALSGYLIFRPFARRDFGSGANIDIRSYALNRALRILPLYLVAIVVLLVLTQHGGSFTQWWRFLLFAQEFWKSSAQTVDGPIWSVVVEIHFYILLPVIAWVLRNTTRGNRTHAVVMLLLAGLISVGFRRLNPNPSVVWDYSILATFYGFVPGMVLALIETSWEERRPSYVRSLVASPDAWLASGFGMWVLICWRPSLASPLTAVGAFLVVGSVVLAPGDGRLVRLLDARPLALIGVASYSLYIWHVPIVAHLWQVSALSRSFPLLLVTAIPICLIAAGASYYLVERPALKLRRVWAKPAAPSHPTKAAAISEVDGVSAVEPAADGAAG